jgi:hypothetical protein
MPETSKLPVGIKIIIGFHLLNILLWAIGQGGAVLFYDIVAKWGLQDSRELLDPVIVEVNRGIGLADMLIMIPLFIIAVIGLWHLKLYGAIASWLALGITLYWPVVFFCSQYFYGQTGIEHKPTEMSVNFILIFLLLFASWASWYLYKNYKLLK